MSVEEVKKRIQEKQEARKAEAAAEIEKHNEGFYLAKEKALDTHDESRLVEVDIPSVGKCLFQFASTPDHAKFTREIHKDIELSPCKTYAHKCVLYPDAKTFVDTLDRKNPEGFVKAALAIKVAMRGVDDAEGKD